MHMPPPVHGAAMVGQWIHDSKLINKTFECHYINPSASSNITEVGKISLKKNYFPILYPISDTESYYQSQTGYMLLHSYIRWMGYL